MENPPFFDGTVVILEAASFFTTAQCVMHNPPFLIPLVHPATVVLYEGDPPVSDLETTLLRKIDIITFYIIVHLINLY
jgi:hypothetical protein